MHELSIALNLLDLAAEEAERQGGGRVTAIHVRIGPLSGVVAEALRSAYELARETSELKSAELVIEEVPLTVFCPVCGVEREPVSGWQLVCPSCGGPTPEIRRGRELELTALELES
jgi:hydrogenase nickel incorporation protein HypA/HybF